MSKTEQQLESSAGALAGAGVVSPAAAYRSRRAARRRTATKTARKDAAAKAQARSRKAARAVSAEPKTGPHPQLVEAQKALAAAKDAYTYAVDAIEGQYVKALIGVGELSGVNALRGAYRTMPEPRYERTSGLRQPAAPRVDEGEADDEGEEGEEDLVTTCRAQPRSGRA